MKTGMLVWRYIRFRQTRNANANDRLCLRLLENVKSSNQKDRIPNLQKSRKENINLIKNTALYVELTSLMLHVLSILIAQPPLARIPTVLVVLLEQVKQECLCLLWFPVKNGVKTKLWGVYQARKMTNASSNVSKNDKILKSKNTSSTCNKLKLLGIAWGMRCGV